MPGGVVLSAAFLNDTTVCIARGPEGLEMLDDISNPVQPNIIKDFVTGQYPNKLALKGQVLFMSDIGVGVELINISNPAAPNVLATYNTPVQAQGLATME